ncbi:MAG: DUF434 domain-containing protein [Candidatus Methanoperedens sp.]|nr:DUF434 domain-containing protein [Candidatus Methanoperedens sp.]PKL53245.1 MAG: DUF434 domain-containing protein [Candidatus Methanoperedenaceae archaeon HGW-Methanoperedenaceae-1]
MNPDAVSDLRYLLDRGYTRQGAVRFVCSHYRLDKEAGHILSRVILPQAVSDLRKTKFLPCGSIRGSEIVIDGYNIIIGMESILEKKAYLCDDGVVRDTKGAFGSYQTHENTGRAIELILGFLKEEKPSFTCFLLDSQISKSGMFAKMLRGKMDECGIEGDARTSKHVDYELKNSECLVASGDGVIIDRAAKVVNFLSCVVSRFKELDDGIIRIDRI